jgi:hypothetical protein
LAPVAVRDVATPTEPPITAQISAAAAIHRRFLLASNCRTLGRRARSAMGDEAAQSGEEAGGGAGVAPVGSGLAAAGGSVVALDTG